MEKSDNAVVVLLDAQWNDISAWPALYDIGTKDGQGNVITQGTTNT
jgi:mannose-1-phosphate guanylyltransferase